MLTKGKARTWKLFSRLRLFVLFLGTVSTFVPAHAQVNERHPEAGRGLAVTPDKDYAVQQIRYGLFWVSDGAYNTMFLVTAEGVIAIDAPPTLGENYLKAIAEVTPQPVRYLVYSHEHTDHIGAAYLFPKSVQIVAQMETAEILAHRKHSHRPIPSITFSDHYELKLGGETMQLEYTGINHERGNIFIYCPREKTLMIVDVVYPGYMPYKNLGITEDIPGYIDVQKKALAYDFSTFVGGHVNHLGDRVDIETSVEFVADLRKTVGAALNSLSLQGFARANASKAKDKWDLHNEYEKAVIDRCYGELLPRWQDRLADSTTYLRGNCWAMMESIIVTLPLEQPEDPAPSPKESP